MNTGELALSDQERVERGQRAYDFKQYSAFDECIKDIYNTLHVSLDNQPTDNAENVLSIIRQLRSLRSFESRLDSWIQEAGRLKND